MSRLQGGRTQDLGQAALARSLPQFHLKKTVLSGHVSLSEKQVMLVLGVDMGNAPAVAQHVYRLFEARHLERALDHGKGGLCPGSKTVLIDAVIGAARAGLSGSGDRSSQKPQGENTDGPLHTGDILSQHDKRSAPSLSFVCLRVLGG